jgi:hypothetical protein
MRSGSVRVDIDVDVLAPTREIAESNTLKGLVGASGFEPPTSWSRTWSGDFSKTPQNQQLQSDCKQSTCWKRVENDRNLLTSGAFAVT